MPDTSTPDYVEHASAFRFDATLQRLVEAISTKGMTVFARIDHAAAARDVGFAMPPTTVLIYGNPKGGTPIMLANPEAALDLPLRVLVREREDGTVAIAFHPIVATLRLAGVPEDAAARFEPAQHLLLAAVAP